jgi:serine/threonine-protein kinase PknK
MLRPSPSPGRGVNSSLRRPKLQRAEVDSLAATTDGWAAPLRLASPSLRECDDPAALIDHMSVRSHGIGEFLAENCSACWSQHCGTSCWPRRSPSGAAADSRLRSPGFHAGCSCSRKLGSEICSCAGKTTRGSGAVAPPHRKLSLTPSRARPARTHRRTPPEPTRWFAEHHHLRKADDHAVAAGDEERAFDLVETDDMYLAEHSFMATLLRIVAKLPSVPFFRGHNCSFPSRGPTSFSSVHRLRRRHCATLSPPSKQASATESRRADRQVDSERG